MSEYNDNGDAVSGVKRKRITFNDVEDVAPAPPPVSTPIVAGLGYINPERLAAIQRDPESTIKAKKVKKEKTVAKKRYLKKKLDKRKKRMKAAKDSAPKSKKDTDGQAEGGEYSDSSDQSDSDDEDDDKEAPVRSEQALDRIKIDSTAPRPTISAYPAVQRPTMKTKAALPTSDTVNAVPESDTSVKDVPAGPESTASAVDPADETVEQRRERRRLEKKAKREERRAEEARLAEKEAERQRLLAEKEKAKAAKRASQKTKPVATEDVDMESSSDEESDEGSSSDDSDANSEASSSSTSSASSDSADSSASINPDGIPSFPLPQAPAKPSQTLLSRQGLPAALSDAVLVTDDERITIDNIKLISRRKSRVGGQDDTVLGDRMKTRLQDMGFKEFFAVQTALIPQLASLPLVPFAEEILNDYLVSAPTGSGKTLAYGVPVVEVLSRRIVTRLRALVILPTRDLVMQVRETMEDLAKGSGLKVGTATGQHSFSQEQVALVGNSKDKLLGGSSKVDILIATPGRLMEHLRDTPNFSLQHLRFLIIDEADRLLTQSFQDWLNQVLKHLQPEGKVDLQHQTETERVMKGHDAVAANWYDGLGLGPGDWEGRRPIKHTCQKLLFSATLTRDPGKIAALHLRNPKYFIVGSGKTDAIEASADATGQQFAIPTSLTERMIVMPPDLKPLNLLHLLHDTQFKIKSALCFTKSVDSTERLLRLIGFFGDAYTAGKRIVAKAYSGELDTGARRKLLAEFAQGEIDLLICSDLIARGIDLPSVSHVISYDAPVDMRKYVHRVGRTARAGKEGTAWTLVEKQEARHFKQMLSQANHLDRVKKVKIKETDLASLRDSYDIALSRLKVVYQKGQ